MSDNKPIMENKMDESRSWMGYSKEIKARENARKTSSRLNRGYKTDVNKAWNNATMGKSKMGHDTSKTKARDNVLKTPSMFTKCCVEECKYDTMEQFDLEGMNITLNDISQENHFALLKMHIEACHPQVLGQAPAGQLSHTPPTLAPESGGARGGSGLAFTTFLWVPLWREPSLWKPAITNTSNPSPKKREEEDNFRYTSPTLQQEDRQV